MQPEHLQKLQTLVNGLTSAGLLWATIGLAFLALKGKTRLPFACWVLVLLTGSATIQYLLPGSWHTFPLRIVCDCLVAAASLMLGYALWPAVLQISRLPGYQELAEAKAKLEEEARARHEMQARQAELQLIVEHTSDSIVVLDTQGKITKWSLCAEEFFGYTAKEAIGKPLIFLSQAGQCADVIELCEHVVREKESQRFEGQQRCKDGRLVDVIMTVSPIFNSPEEVALICVIRDVTKLKESQRQITALNKQLQEQLDELKLANAALEQARDAAIHSSQLKSAFVANISHELRTPLSGILGMSELALTLDLKEETRAMLEVIHQSGEALLSVVNDILDLSKVESGRITTEHQPFNLKFVIQDCANLLSASAKAKKLAFNVDLDLHLPEFVTGDASKVRQVLINLVGNAIKFTEEGSITISARVVNEDKQSTEIIISVADTGVGVAESDKAKLFVPFGLIEKAGTRKYGGTGLGLALSKRFVELMGGELNFKSNEGKGSCFWFSVPFEKQLPTGEISIPHGGRRLVVQKLSGDLTRGRQVLLVEDSRVLNKVILKQLSTLGIEAQGVYNGHDAIEEAATGKYDLVLMDINLPDIDGYEATGVIRKLESKKVIARTIIIALTASAMEGDREKALAAGLDDYIAKPVSIEDLGRTLERWLSQKSKQAKGH